MRPVAVVLSVQRETHRHGVFPFGVLHSDLSQCAYSPKRAEIETLDHSVHPGELFVTNTAKAVCFVKLGGISAAQRNVEWEEERRWYVSQVVGQNVLLKN